MPRLIDTESGRTKTIATFFEVTEFLGDGRFAEVYRALDLQAQTDVALKIYKEAQQSMHDVAKEEYGILIQAEALNTEYFPKPRKYFRTRIQNQNHPIIAMELGVYVEDDGSRRVTCLKSALPLADGTRPPSTPVTAFWVEDNPYRWIVEISEAVRGIHRKNLIHRDLKPDNILLKRGAGGDRPTPFIIDFNTSVGPRATTSRGATAKYLPPEVRTNARTEPSRMDDLWAICQISWEVLFGLDAPIEGAPTEHQFLEVPPSEKLLTVLRKGMSLNASDRYDSADDLHAALIDAIYGKGDAGTAVNAVIPTTSDSLLVSPDELAWARENSDRIRGKIVDLLAGEDELVIPKDVKQKVQVYYSYFAENTTQTLDLETDLISLGTRAIPAMLAEGHRVVPDTPDFRTVVTALGRLGEQDPQLASRSLAYFGLSSNFSVRRLCWAVCRDLKMVPMELIDQLVDEEGLLLPDERVSLADMCISYSKESDAVMALTKYLCLEYLTDPGRYRELRDTVAVRMGELQFEKTALLIVQDAKSHIWDELMAFERIPGDEKRNTLEKGMMQLLGEAFASVEAKSLRLLEAGTVPEWCDDHRLRIWSTFAWKLCQRYEPARQWLNELAVKRPNDRGIALILRKLGEGGAEEDVRLDTVVNSYFSNSDRSSYNMLRFCRDSRLFDLVRGHLEASSDPLITLKILHLMHGFENRKRLDVVKLMIDFWPRLANTNYDMAVDVATGFPVNHDALKNEVLSCLKKDLAGERKDLAMQGMDRLLGQP